MLYGTAPEGIKTYEVGAWKDEMIWQISNYWRNFIKIYAAKESFALNGLGCKWWKEIRKKRKRTRTGRLDQNIHMASGRNQRLDLINRFIGHHINTDWYWVHGSLQQARPRGKIVAPPPRLRKTYWVGTAFTIRSSFYAISQWKMQRLGPNWQLGPTTHLDISYFLRGYSKTFHFSKQK